MDETWVTSVAALLSGAGTFLLVIGLVITVLALARRTRELDTRLRRLEAGSDVAPTDTDVTRSL